MGAVGASTAALSAASVTIDLRAMGAVGDGRVHTIAEAWIGSGEFADLRAVQAVYPFVDTDRWTLDEVAWRRALDALPAAGGTIRLPAGHYVAAAGPWRVMRDGVRLVGEGAERTVLSTAPGIEEGLVLAGYRHVGWRAHAAASYPFEDASARRGAHHVRLVDPTWAAEWSPGDLLFIRNGACRFDQDFGEMNEVAAVEADGTLRLAEPLGREYTEANLAWAGETAVAFRLPAEGARATLRMRRGDGLFLPGRRDAITVGGILLQVLDVRGTRVTVVNPGRGNPPAGTVIDAGARVAKSRAVIRLTATTREFRAEDLTFRGRRKAVNISNSYGVTFERCRIERVDTQREFDGGLVLDGDGGRKAVFRDCVFVAAPSRNMQMARSYGDILFEGCRFENTNVAFTEFTFGAVVRRCVFRIEEARRLDGVVVAGASCNDVLIEDNDIAATGVAAVFEGFMDIQSHRAQGRGPIVIRRNAVRISGETVEWRFPVEADVRGDAASPERHARNP